MYSFTWNALKELTPWIWKGFVFLMVYTIILTWYRRIRNDRIYRKMRELEPVYGRFVTFVRSGWADSNKIRNILPRKDFPHFERYLRNKISSTNELDVSAERTVADVSGFSQYMRRQAARSKGWKKALSLRTLSYLRDPANIPIFRNVLKTTSFYPCIFAAALGLALCGDTESLQDVIKKIYREQSPKGDALLTVLATYGKKAVSKIHQLLMEGSLSVTETCVLIDLLGFFRYQPASSTLVQMLSNTKNTEVLIHVIETLALIGDKETADILLPFLRHQDFRVRLKAVHAIQRLGNRRYMTEIEALLWDNDWWVRRNAAEAISRMGEMGMRRIRKISQSEEEEPRSAAKLILVELKYRKIREKYIYHERRDGELD
jgi:HEAT repeat protein